jgi:L-lactate dehydrogenase complex protein LldE
MTIELFIPCFIDQLYPDTAFNTVKVLEKAGCTVNYNPEQTCCGQPAFNAGFWDDAKTVGTKFLNDFKEDSVIVSPSASCTGMVRNYYNDLFTNTTGAQQMPQYPKQYLRTERFFGEHITG